MGSFILYFGIIEILVGVPFFVNIVRKIVDMYYSLGADLPLKPFIIYSLPIIVVISYGLINIIFGLGNLGLIMKSKPDAVYKVGNLLAILSFITTALFLLFVYFSFTPQIM